MPTVSLLTYFVLIVTNLGLPEESPADALNPEQVRRSIQQLDDSRFERREQAVLDLFALGQVAIPALQEAAETGKPEVAVRAFDVLYRLYYIDDETTYESVERTFQYLMHVENLSATSRAERLYESVSDLRQIRASSKLERLGATVHYADPAIDRQSIGRPRIDYLMFGREWGGNDDDFRLVMQIEDLRTFEGSSIYIVRGVNLSDAMRAELLARMPTLNIQMRGPARLGVSNSVISRGNGCVIGKVEPGTAADGAGLQLDDEVIEIDGQEVHSFEKLIEIIGQKEPGDMVQIVYRRAGEEMRGVAHLSAWSKKVVRPNEIQKP